MATVTLWRHAAVVSLRCSASPCLPSNKARRRATSIATHLPISATALRQLLHTIISISYSRLVIVVDTRELKLAALLPRNPHRSKKHFLVYLHNYFSFQVCLSLPGLVTARQDSINQLFMEVAPKESTQWIPPSLMLSSYMLIRLPECPYLPK